ncbi:MAG: hypothetical protein EAZ85_09475 [Bacteroidetes bacterium]|nr:MAG: hypothetical protein EAZ85_09475 [Bacteroidota bacterium]TAG88637.1 MAG: hypothetical protein EAZ20_08110 [Bacteroidota bacterium]
MKKILNFVILIFVYLCISNIAVAQINQKRLYQTWKPTSLELADKTATQDKKDFANKMSVQMKFQFVNQNELEIFVPMIEKSTIYNWKFLDADKTIIEAIEKNPTFVESPVKWLLKIKKLNKKELILEDLADEKRGNIWNLVPFKK